MATISMSERDYATLTDAAAWVQLHSGVDAPEYSRLNELSRVVEAIARRRPIVFDEVGLREPRARCSDLVEKLYGLRDRAEQLK